MQASPPFFISMSITMMVHAIIGPRLTVAKEFFSVKIKYIMDCMKQRESE